MEFTIKQNVLRDELAQMQGIVEKKSTIPVLSNVRIESIGADQLQITGTDLDTTLQCQLEAVEIKQEGAICVQARKLYDIVRLLPTGADVHFNKEPNDWVKLQCSGSNFRLAGINPDSFPEVAAMPAGNLLKMPQDLLRRFIAYTSFAITNETSRFTLSGAKFEISGSIARMITTDGHRLAFIEQPMISAANGKPLDILIPKKTLNEVAKLISDDMPKSESEETDGNPAAKIERPMFLIAEDFHHIFFQFESRLFISRKLSGQFPNYEMVIPKANTIKARFKTAEILSSLTRVSQMADHRTNSVILELARGACSLSTKSSEEGEAKEFFDGVYNDDPLSIKFNLRYLSDVLQAIERIGESKDGQVLMRFADERTQIVVEPIEVSYRCLEIIMPLQH